MPQQVSSTDKIIFPDGVALELSNDSGASYHNIGVLAAGTTATYNYDKIITESGNAGTLLSRIKNQTMAIAPSALYDWDPEIWEKFSGGAFAYTNVAGTPVVGGAEVIAVSAIPAYDQAYVIANQNGDGTVPTINSVTGSVDGLLVTLDDYDFVKVQGGWAIVIHDTVTVTTLAQTFTINSDYTPSSGKKINAGTSSLELSTFIARLRHYTDDALTTYDTELIIHAADLDSGMGFNFKGANEDGVQEITVAMTGKVDTSRTDGDQLFQLFIGADAYTN